MEGAAQPRQSAIEKIVEDLAALGLDAHRANQNQLVEKLWRHGRDLGRHPAAERAADDVDWQAQVEIAGEPRDPGGGRRFLLFRYQTALGCVVPADGVA